jgi:hypothetical protein
MCVVPIIIEPFTIDDPNANYGVQLTGEVQSIVAEENKAFFMIERFNSAMSARLPLTNGNAFRYQLVFSSDVNTSAMHAAYLLNLTTVFLTQKSDLPDDAEDRALVKPPIVVEEGQGYGIFGNTLVMSPPDINGWEFSNSVFTSRPIKVQLDGNPGDQVLFHLQIMGTLGIQTRREGPIYYLPFTHDPMMVITVNG